MQYWVRMAVNGDRGQMTKASLIIDLLASSANRQAWWGVRELSKQLGLSATTIHRTLQVLMDVGYVRQDPESGRYAIGTELRRVAAMVRDTEHLVRIARPFLRQLSDHTGQTSILGELDAVTHSMMFVDIVPGEHPLDYEVPLYKHLSLYRGASGLSVLAFLPSGGRPSQAERQSSIRSVRRAGYAITRGDRIPGAIGISAPLVIDGGPVLGSITLTIPQSRTPSAAACQSFSRLVLECASRIRNEYKASGGLQQDQPQLVLLRA